MTDTTDTNAAIWKSEQVVQNWTARAGEREAQRAEHWRFMGELLPYGVEESFTFLDLGAGTGAAARGVLSLYPRANAVLADFSQQMMGEGVAAMEPYSERYRYVEFDMTSSDWPLEIPESLGAVVTSMCVHHIPDARKETLFGEIFSRLAPGGWYVNYDPITAEDGAVETTWERVNDRSDPDAAHKRMHRNPEELARYENHVRYMIPLERQLGYLRAAGFEAIDVYWKKLENVIYGGRRPA